MNESSISLNPEPLVNGLSIQGSKSSLVIELKILIILTTLEVQKAAPFLNVLPKWLQEDIVQIIKMERVCIEAI